MAAEEHEFTPTGKIKQSDVEQLYELIREAWARILPTLIEKFFRSASSPTSLMAQRIIYGTVIPTM
jgi:hypothetical protein